MNDEVARRERELLEEAYQYLVVEQRFPDNVWLGKKLGLGSNGVSNLKKNLKDKGYLEGEPYKPHRFTEKAFEYLENIQDTSDTVIPSIIRV